MGNGGVRQNLGPVSAYALAVKHGYIGTEEEWAQEQAQAGTYAHEAKTAAGTAKEAAEQATTSAEAAAKSEKTASAKAGEATTSANNAATSADHASKSATTAANAANSAELSARGARESADNASSSADAAGTHAHNASLSEDDAKKSAESASTSENNAGSAAQTASSAASAATSKAADAEQAAQSAATSADSASGSATAAAGSADTATVKASEAAKAAETATTKAQAAAASAEEAKNAAIETVDKISKTEAGNIFTPAIKVSTCGEVIAVDDVSPIEHDVYCKITSDSVTDLTQVKVIRCRKNLLSEKIKDMSNWPLGTEHGFNSGIIFLLALPHKEVTISCAYSGVEAYVYIYESVDGSVWDRIKERNGYLIAKNTHIPITFTPDTNKKYAIWSNGKGSFDAARDLQVEFGNKPTTYEEPKQTTFTPTADGTVSDMRSIAPSMTLFPDAPGVLITTRYNADTAKYISNNYVSKSAVSSMEARIADLEKTTIDKI